MNKRTTLRTAAAAILVGCSAVLPAQAFADDSSVYVRADVGGSLSGDTSGDIFRGTGFGQNFGDNFMFDAGVGFGVGSFSDMGLRVEATAGYRPGRNGFHSAPNAAGNTTLSTTTNIDTFTLFGNGYVDFATSLPVTPYVGGGLGLAQNKLNPLTYFFNTATGAIETGKTTSNFAWQLMAGFSAPVIPGVTADVGYHYLDAGAVRSSGSVTLTNGVTSSQPPVQSNLHAHEITFGLRIGF